MKKLVRAQADVKLERIEYLAARQKRMVEFRLTTHRNAPERFILEEAEAQRAFAREVAASLEDRTVQDRLKRSALGR